MRVSELIARLEKYNPDMEVTILDGFNGGGTPRAINFGPTVFDGKSANDTDERKDYSDIDSDEEASIVIMGYGCY